VVLSPLFKATPVGENWVHTVCAPSAFGIFDNSGAPEQLLFQIRVFGGPCDGDELWCLDDAGAREAHAFLVARARRAQTEGWL
jgi:hypothetical protein